MQLNLRDAACGGLFLALGLYFLVGAFRLEIGTAFRMGPGFFPLLLAGILMLLGVVVVVQSAAIDNEPIGPIAWRGMLLILPGPIVFALTVRGLGLVPAVALTGLIGSFASQRMKPLTAILLVIGLSAFCYAVFTWGVGLAVRPFGPWLGF
jgi:hypothetical protein